MTAQCSFCQAAVEQWDDDSGLGGDDVLCSRCAALVCVNCGQVMEQDDPSIGSSSPVCARCTNSYSDHPAVFEPCVGCGREMFDDSTICPSCREEKPMGVEDSWTFGGF